MPILQIYHLNLSQVRLCWDYFMLLHDHFHLKCGLIPLINETSITQRALVFISYLVSDILFALTLVRSYLF